MNFKEYLKNHNEFLTENKNTHMEHIEDEIINKGIQGAVDVVKRATNLLSLLHTTGKASKDIGVSTKWDGSPAIFCGLHPETKQFFVATKSLFNKTPKVNYSNADIDKNHSGELANKLKIALKYIPQLGINTILQGDLMYSSSDLKEKNIDGEKYVTFQPNTIEYAVPVNSELAKQIKTSKMGIVFHTEYTGSSIDSLSASFNINISHLNKTKDVWYQDAFMKDYSGATLSPQEQKIAANHLLLANNALKKINKSELNTILKHKKLPMMLKTYTNANIRKGEIVKDTKKFIQGFFEWIENRLETEKSKLKTDKAKSARDAQKKELFEFINKYKKTLTSLLDFQIHIIDVKHVLIKKLEKVENMKAFLPQADGTYKVSPAEGFVVIDKISGNALKLVDRLGFSMANFNAIKNWSK